MNCLKRFSFALAFCLAASVPSWSQTTTPMPQAKYVYVATGGNQIYAVSTTTDTTAGTTAGQAYQLIPSGNSVLSSADTFTSLTIGPDNSSDNASGEYFYLYACSTANNVIIRLQLSLSPPNQQANAVDTVYNGGSIAGPVCGRVDSVGDLYVSGASAGVAGSGVWAFSSSSSSRIPNPSEVAAGTLGTPKTPTDFNAPTQVYDSSVVGSTFTGGGISQKNNGDLLVVDNHDGTILRARFLGANVPSSVTSNPPFSDTLAGYVPNLSAPNAIARISTGDFFVADQGASDILKFHPVPNNPTPTQTTCSVSIPTGNVTVSSVAASEDNFVYIGIASTSQNKRVIQVLDGTAAQCGSVTSIPLAALSSATTVAAVAVPPVSESAISPPIRTPDSGNLVSQFNFGSSVFQVTTTDCTPTVTQRQVPLSFLQPLVDKASPPQTSGTWFGGKAVGYKGEGGFGTLYSGTPVGCTVADVQTAVLIGALLDTTQFTNPRIIHCEDDFNTCEVADATGNWPTGGYINDDPTIGSGKTNWSQFFLANGDFSSSSSAEPGTFCGFQSPLSGLTDEQDPTVVSTNNLSVKFKLALASSVNGDCSNGPYITDAVALLSIEQVVDSTGASVFNPINVKTQGKSTSNPPIFKYNSTSQNYQFSLSLKGYSSGVYAMIVTLLTGNPLTDQQYHRSYVVTYFQVP